MKSEIRRTGCYTSDAYRVIRLLNVIYGNTLVHLHNSMNQIIAKVNIDKPYSTRISGIFAKAFDGEILLVKLPSEPADPLPALLDLLKYLIAAIKSKRGLQPNAKFWIVPPYSKDLKNYIGSMDAYWTKIYDSGSLDEVLKNEWFSLRLLEKALSDFENHSTEGKINDPFIIEKKKLLMLTLQENYIVVYREIMKEIDALSRKYRKYPLSETNFIYAVLKSEKIIKYMIDGRYDKMEEAVKILVGKYAILKNISYVNDIGRYVRRLMETDLFKAYRSTLIDISDESLGFSQVPALLDYMMTFKEAAVASLY